MPYRPLRLEDALRGADLVLRPTEWPPFRAIDPVRAAPLVARSRIVDGRGALDADRWAAAGWYFRAPGTPAPAGEGQCGLTTRRRSPW